MKVELKKWEGLGSYELLIDSCTAICIIFKTEDEKPNLVISRKWFNEISITVTERANTINEAKEIIEKVGKGIELRYEVIVGGVKTIS